MELDQAESNNYYISKESNNSLRIENTLNYFIKSNLETKLNKKEEQNNEEFFLVVPVEVIKDNFAPKTNDNIDNNYDKTNLNDNNDKKAKITKNNKIIGGSVVANKTRTEKNKIFDTKKINKRIGRRKQDKPELYKYEAVHTKYRQDNIIQKIKIYFINSTMALINKKYNEYLNTNSKKRLIQKIKPNFTKIFTKKGNQEFLEKKLKVVFSEELSERCSTFHDKKNYNKEQIEKLYEKNKAKDVINILNKSLKEMYRIYIMENNEMNGYNLKYDLIQIEQKNGKEYAQEYNKKAMEFLSLFD
jgi:hypothetical protein